MRSERDEPEFHHIFLSKYPNLLKRAWSTTCPDHRFYTKSNFYIVEEYSLYFAQILFLHELLAYSWRDMNFARMKKLVIKFRRKWDEHCNISPKNSFIFLQTETRSQRLFLIWSNRYITICLLVIMHWANLSLDVSFNRRPVWIIHSNDWAL